MAFTLLSLGRLAQKRGDRDLARTLFEWSISSFERSQANDPELAQALGNLAGLLQEEGNTKEALRLYERALAVRRKIFGDRHRQVAESWHQVARARLGLHDTAGALEAARTGVDTFRAVVAPDSSDLAGGLFLLGNLLRLNGRPAEGLPYLEEAHAIWQKQPPASANDLANLDAALAATRAALKGAQL